MFFAEYLSGGRYAPKAAGPPWLYAARFFPRTAQDLSGSCCLTGPLFIACNPPKTRISDVSPFWLPNPPCKFVGDKKQL